MSLKLDLRFQHAKLIQTHNGLGKQFTQEETEGRLKCGTFSANHFGDLNQAFINFRTSVFYSASNANQNIPSSAMHFKIIEKINKRS